MSRYTRNHETRGPRRTFWGLALIVTGCIFLGARLGYYDVEIGWHFFPAIIGVFGLMSLVFARNFNDVVRGVFRIALAAWLFVCFEEIGGWTFHDTWPAILIAYGVSIALRGLTGTSRHTHEESAQ